jgi:hypothetical protein
VPPATSPYLGLRRLAPRNVLSMVTVPVGPVNRW